MQEQTETNLDDSLDELEQQIQNARQEKIAGLEAEETAAAINQQQQLHNDIMSLLYNAPGGPKPTDVEAWKDQYGEDAVYVLGLGPGDVYVYTALTLGQWEKIQSIIQQAQGTPMAEQVEKILRERVIRTTVIWPTLDSTFFNVCRAGVPDSLYQAILLHSYFLTPQQVMTLTVQL